MESKSSKDNGEEGKVISMSEEKSLFETMGIDYEERNGLLYPIFEEETATENDDEIVSTEQNKKDLLSVKKIDSMLSQLKRDHFVSFWN